MPTPDRKKSKHKKKDKDSSHRSVSKHKSKKKVKYNAIQKISRSPSRNREKKKDYKKQPQSPLNKGMSDVFGGFGDILKKLQEFKDGKKPEDIPNYAFWSYLKPTQENNENAVKEQKVIKEKKSRQRLLIPLNYDTLMIILEDPFYEEYLSDEMIRSMRKKLISSMKKSSEPKSDQFIKKIYQLEQDLKRQIHQVEEPEQPPQLGVIQSIFSVLNNEKSCLDKEIADLFDAMEEEPIEKEVNEIFEEAKQQLFM